MKLRESLFVTERAQWNFSLPGVPLEACAGPGHFVWYFLALKSCCAATKYTLVCVVGLCKVFSVLIVIVESLEICCGANGMFSHGRT
jgi:hypothetical protein